MIKLSYSNKGLSEKEFLRLMEKRVKKEVRGLNPVEEIVIEAPKRDFQLIKHFLERIYKEPKIIAGKSPIKALSLEEEASIALKLIEKGEKPEKLHNLLGKITEEEIEHLCKIFEINNIKPSINKFLEGISKKHPDVKFGFAQALEELR